jgi:tryptophanyl-tRNA synthetase
MSKSAGSAASYIALTDDADTITRKIKRAVTDSGSDVTAGPDKPALTNLLTIYSLFSGEPIPVLEERFAGRGYGAFKLALADLLVEALRPIQTRLAELEAHPEVAVGVLAEGAVRARVHAERTMKLVRDRMGLTLSAV